MSGGKAGSGSRFQTPLLIPLPKLSHKSGIGKWQHPEIPEVPLLLWNYADSSGFQEFGSRVSWSEIPGVQQLESFSLCQSEIPGNFILLFSSVMRSQMSEIPPISLETHKNPKKSRSSQISAGTEAAQTPGPVTSRNLIPNFCWRRL